MTVFSKRITFVIFTYNEEARIERAIKSFISYGKVLVVDNFSTDATIDIAKRNGCDVLMNKNPGWVEDEVTTANVFDAITTPWVYWAYADEIIEKKSIEKIQYYIECNDYDIISIRRKNYYYGQFCYNAFSDRLNRVFRVGAIDFSGNKIHEFGKVLVAENRIFTLPEEYYVHHFISNTATSYLRVMDKYTDIQAPKEIKCKNPLLLILQSVRCFIVHYFIRGAFKAGVAGFYLVINMIYYSWLLNMKKYELDHHVDFKTIEDLNNKHRDKILEGEGGGHVVKE
ncbi:glycosyltransferase [Aeromonas veronii bv. sobria]|uniref:glycosyltransferase n=1 Tax=Aeromonas veronii TaxID=654 RepID=UPI0035C1717A